MSSPVKVAYLPAYGGGFYDREHRVRHDPAVIAEIEAGTFPDKDVKVKALSGNKYRVEEYDGWESVHEPDDYEWVEVTS
jgi:hypothetical protein